MHHEILIVARTIGGDAVKYVLVWEKETIIQCMNCTFIRTVQIPQILYNGTDSGIQNQSL